MKFPRAMAAKLDDIPRVVSSWPADVEISQDDVVKWIMQFDEDDFDLAIRVITNLNIVGQRDVQTGLRVAYSKLMRKAIEKGTRVSGRNTLFAAVGSVGKSGAMIGYHFRLLNEVSEENFLSDETEKMLEAGMVENIVLVDDVISTGNQASREVMELTERVVPLGVKNIFLLTVCGMKDGMRKVEEETKAYTFSAFEYASIDTASSLDSAFYDGIPHEGRAARRERLRAYGQICYPSNPLGYGGIGGLLAFQYNTPNSTLPIIWSERDNWIPLLKRITRVNGISSYYKQMENAVRKKADAAAGRSEIEGATGISKETDLTLFVEGKRDEIFFEFLVKKIDLADRLESRIVEVVSLAGGMLSERLLRSLAQIKPSSVFVFEREERGPSQAILKKAESLKLRYVEIENSFMSLVDVTKLLEHPEIAPYIEHGLAEGKNAAHESIRKFLERDMLRRFSMERITQIIRLLVDDCLDTKATELFVQNIRRVTGSRQAQAN